MTQQARLMSNLIKNTSLAFFLAFTLLLASETAESAPRPADGGFLKVGVGYSPLARTTVVLSDLSLFSSGAALSLSLGTVWSRTHSISVHWSNIYLSENASGSQGVIALVYTHYYQRRGPSPFISVGVGLQRGPFISDLDRVAETDDGAAALLGFGLCFGGKFEIAADYSFGSTNRSFGQFVYYDYRHRQLMFTLRYNVLGG